jgi:hypothetical protein
VPIGAYYSIPTRLVAITTSDVSVW